MVLHASFLRTPVVGRYWQRHHTNVPSQGRKPNLFWDPKVEEKSHKLAGRLLTASLPHRKRHLPPVEIDWNAYRADPHFEVRRPDPRLGGGSRFYDSDPIGNERHAGGSSVG